MSDSESAEEPFDTYLDVGLLVGVWSDLAVVHRERDVFTIDFVRKTPVTSERILVARVLVSPVVAADLRDVLDKRWRAYFGWSRPEEDR